ncbi:MAG TPA: nitroreductase/quinone reductase family protein [Acidimicrobiales bacterium]
MDERKFRRIRFVQRHLVNPPAKALAWLGLTSGLVLLETTGRRSGRRRRTVVGMHVEGDTGWVIAEHGRRAGYVRNIEAHPEVRVRRRRRWIDARATLLPDDDAEARLRTFHRRSHEAAVHRFGTDPRTIRFDLTP